MPGGTLKLRNSIADRKPLQCCVQENTMKTSAWTLFQRYSNNYFDDEEEDNVAMATSIRWSAAAALPHTGKIPQTSALWVKKSLSGRKLQFSDRRLQIFGRRSWALKCCPLPLNSLNVGIFSPKRSILEREKNSYKKKINRQAKIKRGFPSPVPRRYGQMPLRQNPFRTKTLETKPLLYDSPHVPVCKLSLFLLPHDCLAICMKTS